MDLKDRNDIDDKRSITDRRKRPTPSLSRYTFFGGRRKIIRRQENKRKHNFVDLYSPSLLITLLVVLILTSLAVVIFFSHFSINGIFKELKKAFQ